jgi:hypothetical protein
VLIISMLLPFVLVIAIHDQTISFIWWYNWVRSVESLQKYLLDWLTLSRLFRRFKTHLLALLRTYDGNQSLSKLNFANANQITKRFLESKVMDVLCYRDISFESIVDTKNKKMTQVCKPWIENKDDSMENLLNDYRKNL